MNNNNGAMPLRNFRLGDPNLTLSPHWVTGIVDAEGSFGITMTQTSSETWKIKFEFKVTQLARNAGILYDLQRFFGVGTVVVDNRRTNGMKYHVTGREALINIIIPHFINYPLVTSKAINFNSFKDAIFAVAGLIDFPGTLVDYVRGLKTGMNTGRSFRDKFNALVPPMKLFPEWVQAFVDGEGTFYAYIAMKTSRNSTYQGVDLSMEVAQASHDVAVLLSLVAFFNGGYISPKGDFTDLVSVQALRAKLVFKLRDVDAITSFFSKYPLLTDKRLDYLDFKAISDIKRAGGHNTVEGLYQIKALKAGMNKGRKGLGSTQSNK